MKARILPSIVLSCLPYLLYPLIIAIHLWGWVTRDLNGRQFLAKVGLLRPFLGDFEERDCTWVHVSSLGEFNTALPFLRKYQREFPSPLLITYFNPDVCRASGLEQIASRHFPLPFELPWAYKAILSHFHIQRLFIFETELWPVLMSVAHRHSRPAFNINGYIDREHLSSYRRLAWLFRPALSSYRHLFARRPEDKKHFIELGVPKENITVVGNLKLDLLASSPPLYAFPGDKKIAKADKLLKAFGQHHLTLVLASIHKKEIPLLLPLLGLPSVGQTPLRWVIAPRYLKHLPLIEKWLKDVPYQHFSALSDKGLKPSSKALVLDEYGLLRTAYRYAHLAIIGGSFIPFGGQNVLEPIAQNVKTLTGPYHHHFEDVVREFARYIDVVEVQELTLLIQEWARFPDSIPKDNGYRHLQTCGGASDNTLRGLKKYLI